MQRDTTVHALGREAQARTRWRWVALVALTATAGLVSAADTAPASPVKIAVFNFELEDATPSAVLLDQKSTRAATMGKVSSEARRELAQSGRYQVIDPGSVDTEALPGRSLHNCGGCEADMALKLGAEQALVGVVRPVTQTDYYIVIQIRDARTGKVLDVQDANFAGSEEGWPSGARMLIKHQILTVPN